MDFRSGRCSNIVQFSIPAFALACVNIVITVPGSALHAYLRRKLEKIMPAQGQGERGLQVEKMSLLPVISVKIIICSIKLKIYRRTKDGTLDSMKGYFGILLQSCVIRGAREIVGVAYKCRQVV